MYKSDSYREDFNDISYFKFLLKFLVETGQKQQTLSTETYLSLSLFSSISDTLCSL
jgi:hypothetical protein